MKLLLLIDNFGSGGAQRQIISLASLLKERGFNVEFLIYDKNDFFKPWVEQLGITIHEICLENLLKRLFTVRSHIRKNNYNVVISYMDTPNFLNCFAAIGGHNWKVITNERSCKESIFYNKKNRIYNWFQKWSDILICNSYKAKNMWEFHHPEYKDKLYCIYNPIILPDFNKQYQPLKGNKLHIVVAASFQSLKNSINLAKAVALLNNNQKNKLHIDWYGNRNVSLEGTSVYEKTLEIIQNNNLQSVLELHEPTSDITNKMNQADCVGLFSRLEGLPNTICEGMMLGKVIIMTRVSDYSNLVDESNGVLCEWDNIESIAEALANLLLLTKTEIAQMGEASYNKAKSLFDKDVIAKQWIKIISKI